MIGKAIAVLMLIAVTIVLAIALTSYITSVITPLYKKYSEILLVKGDSYITKGNNSYILKLHLYTNIKPLIVIYAIEIYGIVIKLNTINTKIISVNSGSAILSEEGLTMTPGTDLWIYINTSKNFNMGNYVEIKVYTSTGYVYKGMLTLK